MNRAFELRNSKQKSGILDGQSSIKDILFKVYSMESNDAVYKLMDSAWSDNLPVVTMFANIFATVLTDSHS